MMTAAKQLAVDGTDSQSYRGEKKKKILKKHKCLLKQKEYL